MARGLPVVLCDCLSHFYVTGKMLWMTPCSLHDTIPSHHHDKGPELTHVLLWCQAPELYEEMYDEKVAASFLQPRPHHWLNATEPLSFVNFP